MTLDDGATPMSDRAGGEADAEGAVERGTEHLQAAAREMLSAARAFLDAIEDLVDDPERIRQLGHAVGTVADQAARLGRSAFGADPVGAWFDREHEPDGEGADPADGEPLF